jgi:hypothetical protein
MPAGERDPMRPDPLEDFERRALTFLGRSRTSSSRDAGRQSS